MSEQAASPEQSGEAVDPIESAIEIFLLVQDGTGEPKGGFTGEATVFGDAQIDGPIDDLSLPENQNRHYSPTGILQHALDRLQIDPNAQLEGHQLESLQQLMIAKYESAAQRYAAKHINFDMADNPYADKDQLQQMAKQAQRRRQVFARRRSSER